MTAFTTQSYWEKLDRDEQRVVVEESQALGRALFQVASSRLEMGKRMIKLRDTLKEYFRDHMRNFHISERTYFRIIEDYKETTKLLTPKVMPVIMAANRDFGRKSYRLILKKNPPPDTSDSTQILSWADGVEREHKAYMKAAKGRKALEGEIVRPTVEPEALLEKAFRPARLQFHRLSTEHKVRSNWMRKLVGMLMTELGVSGQMSFSPVAVPEEFRRGRGRPPLEAK